MAAQRELDGELASERQAAFDRRGDEERQVRAQAIDDVARSGILDRALTVGDCIPPFSLPDASGSPVSIGDLLAKGPVVLSFYRGGWCPYCNLELRAFQRHLPDFRALGATLIAISPEQPDNSLSTVEKNALEFPVLSDRSNAVAYQFGIVHRIDPRVVALQKGNGVDVAAVNDAPDAEVPLPATYVVDESGVIRFAVLSADYTRRAEPSAVIDAVRQIVAAHHS